MKKSLIAIAVLVLVAAGAILPAGYFGEVTERTLKERLANMPYGYQMELADYQRGWFSSTARLEWRPLAGVPLPGAIPPDPAPFAADVEIAHGPVYFAVSPGVGLFQARGRVFLGAEASEETLHSPDNPANDLEVRLSSFSGRTVHNRIRAGSLRTNAGGLLMEIEDFLLEGEWAGPGSFQLQHAALGHMDMTLDIPEAQVLRITLADLHSKTEYPQGFSGGAILAESESVTSLGELDIQISGGDTVMRMAKLESVSSVPPPEGELFTVTGATTMEELEVMGRTFAPVRMTQETGGLSQARLSQLIEATLNAGMIEAAPAGPSAAAGDAPAEPPAATLPELPPELKEAFLAMLADSPYSRLEVMLNYGTEEAVSVSLHQGFDGSLAPDTADGLNIAAFIAGADYFLQLEVPIAIAGEVLSPQLLQLGLAQGLLEQDEEDYFFSMSLRNGAFRLNGKRAPLPIPTPGTVIQGEPAT